MFYQKKGLFYNLENSEGSQTSSDNSLDGEISHETSIFSSTTDDPTSDLDSIDAEPNIYTDTESIDRFFLGKSKRMTDKHTTNQAVDQKMIGNKKIVNYINIDQVNKKVVKHEYIGKIKLNLSLVYDEKKYQIISMTRKNMPEIATSQNIGKKDENLCTNTNNYTFKTNQYQIDNKEYLIYKIVSSDNVCSIDES